MKIITPAIYSSINELRGPNGTEGYITNVYTDESRETELKGLLDRQGKELIKPKYVKTLLTQHS